MTIVDVSPATASRVGGWLLILSLPAFILVPVTNIIVFAQAGIGLFADITREQMDALGGQWVVSVLTVYLAVLVGNVGVILVARQLRGTTGAVWALPAAAGASLAVVVGVVDAVLRITAGGFSESRLGESGLFQAAEVLSNITFSSSALGIVLLAVSYFVSGSHRATGVVVGALGGVLFVVSVVAYAFVPPFALALLWLPLGVVWLVELKRARTMAI